jgi:hypothetical protein
MPLRKLLAATNYPKNGSFIRRLHRFSVGCGYHCVGWAKRSVPNIKAKKLLAWHPSGIFVRWARFALRQTQDRLCPTYGKQFAIFGSSLLKIKLHHAEHTREPQ